MSISNFLKYNKRAYGIYYYAMSFIVNLLKLFVRPNDKLILFNSFGGRKFDDSPKEIFEAIKKDKRFEKFELVWAFHKPESFSVEGATKVNTNSLKFLITALSARVWITNSSIERGLNFKGKNTLYVNTWHGTPIKKMGSDIGSNNQSFKKRGKNGIDIMISQSRYETAIFSNAFDIPAEHFWEVGLPRNDVLANHTEEERRVIRDRLGVSAKKMILYAPTYREYSRDNNLNVTMAPPINIERWERDLGDDYILAVRAHYEVSKLMDFTENGFARNMKNYPNLNELLIAADVLVSDYSSIFFDFSITGKPMICFTYDYDEYESKRGMYFDIRKHLSGGETEEELIEILKDLDVLKESEKTKMFRDEYVDYYGRATESTVKQIAEKLAIG